MKKTYLFVSCILLIAISSCNKQNNATEDPGVLKPPSGFLWEMSRNVDINIGIKDDRFGDVLHTIALYDRDPETGGKLITLGAASTGKPFIATIYLADTLQSLFVVKTSPDSAAIQQEVILTANTGIATMGTVPVPTGKPLEGPDCTTGCGRSISVSNNNINIATGETVCITGNNITVSYTANNSGTVRICGSNVVVQNSNLNNNSKLIVTSTATVTFQNLNINTGIIFENYGTCTIPNGFAPNGPVTNAGTLTIGNDFSINGSGTVTNRGTISVAGNMNVNAGPNTNRGNITTKNFTINSNAVFSNFCKLLIADDYNGNGKMDNYQLISVGKTTTVNKKGEIGLYNSSMFTTKDIDLNDMIKGYGTTSLVKVANRTTINKNAGASGAIQYCDANGIETNNAGTSAFSTGAVQACSVYIPVSSCNSAGNGTPAIVDRDGDGASDPVDAYPTDPLKAFNNYYPTADGKATFAFEDLWPSKGDYDFNDMVLDYRYNIITNASNKVVTVIANFTLLASGGILSNGFGVEFPLTRSGISNVTGATLEANQANAVIILFTNMRQQMQWGNSMESEPQTAPVPFTVRFDVTNGPSLSNFGIGTYNPFIWNNGTATATSRNEIHLPGHHPTSLSNNSLFGTIDDNTSVTGNRFYLSKDGMPWALTIPGTFKYPKEAARVTSAYLHFAGWANSGGLSFTNWYTDLAGNRVNSFIYKP